MFHAREDPKNYDKIRQNQNKLDHIWTFRNQINKISMHKEKNVKKAWTPKIWWKNWTSSCFKLAILWSWDIWWLKKAWTDRHTRFIDYMYRFMPDTVMNLPLFNLRILVDYNSSYGKTTYQFPHTIWLCSIAIHSSSVFNSSIVTLYDCLGSF